MSNQSRSELIHCPSCGEDYSDAYRRCPFCNAKRPKPGDYYEEPDNADYYEDGQEESSGIPPFRSSGKRLNTNRRGGGYGGRSPVAAIICVIAVVVIIAALLLFFFVIGPKLGLFHPKASKPTPKPPVETVSPSTEPTPQAPSEEPSEFPTEEPSDLPTEEPSVLPSEEPSVQPPAVDTPVGSLTLSRDDITLSDRWPDYVFEVTGASGSVTWSSADTSVATVTSNGKVTAVGKGTTTVTATDEGGVKASCIIRVANFSGSAAGSASGSDNSAATQAPASQAPVSTSATLSTTDFTLSDAWGFTAQLTVRGGEAASWSSSDETIATVDQYGNVTGHAAGTAKITCTLTDGAKLESIVRVHK